MKIFNTLTRQLEELVPADGKTLLAYPAGKGSSYTVPAGTEVIAAESFRWCEALTDVTIPEGVTKIAPLAFCDTLNLTAIHLPESLQTIGSAAFGKGLGSVSVSAVFVTVGSNLTSASFANISFIPLINFSFSRVGRPRLPTGPSPSRQSPGGDQRRGFSTVHGGWSGPGPAFGSPSTGPDDLPEEGPLPR